MLGIVSSFSISYRSIAILEPILLLVTLAERELLKLCWLSLPRFTSEDPHLKVPASSLAGVGVLKEESSLLQHTFALEVIAAVEYGERYSTSETLVFTNTPAENATAFHEQLEVEVLGSNIICGRAGIVDPEL